MDYIKTYIFKDKDGKFWPKVKFNTEKGDWQPKAEQIKDIVRVYSYCLEKSRYSEAFGGAEKFAEQINLAILYNKDGSPRSYEYGDEIYDIEEEVKEH
ncbi:MAG: hypothetical protein ACKKMS_03375 [Candidatus Nealsonbacteria bacterium]